MDKKLTPAEIVIVASGLAVFVFSFFDYFSFDFGGESAGTNAWDEFPLFTYGALLGLIAAAQILATKLGNVQLPSEVMGFTWAQVHLVLAVFALLTLIGVFLIDYGPADTGIGLIVGLLGSIGMVVGAVMLRQEGARPRSI